MRTLNLDPLPHSHSCTYAQWQFTRFTPAPPLHDHNFHEIFWVTAGSGVHHINGETRPLAPGQLVLVHAKDRHGFSAIDGSPPLQFVNFAFRITLWKALQRRHLALQGAWFDQPDHRLREHTLDTLQLERIHQLTDDLIAGARDELATEAGLIGVICLLSYASQQRKQGCMPAWLANACERMREPRHFVAGTAAFARLAGCSPAHLSREVRRHLKCTPTNLINASRLAYAGQLLTNTTMPIVDIAAECGFENLGYFYKIFHRHHGASPLRYRRHAVLPWESSEAEK